MQAVLDKVVPLSSDLRKKWFNSSNQHWYIIGGQHTVLFRNRIATQIATIDKKKHNFQFHKVIIVHRSDPLKYVAFSNFNHG